MRELSLIFIVGVVFMVGMVTYDEYRKADKKTLLKSSETFKKYYNIEGSKQHDTNE